VCAPVVEQRPPEAVFEPRDGGFLATQLARGPWDPGSLHGGAPAALLMRAFEQLPVAEGLEIARVTYELLRPTPLGELAVDAEVIRGGRRVQLLGGAIRTLDGIELVRARALQVQRVDPSTPTTSDFPPPPGPELGRDHEPEAEGFNPPHRPMFAPDAIEIRFVEGVFGRGPATAWFRLRVPIVAGEEPTPLQRLAAAGDFGNGISAVLPWDRYAFMNPDLTLYLERPPLGEWIGLESRTTILAGGVGTAESTLFDTRGRVGHAMQALLVAGR
jgi:Thioesterase-like superfamily